MEKGITVAGNIMVDLLRFVDGYPREGMLATVKDIGISVGGVLGNTAVDLAIIDPSVQIKAIGRIGSDENGAFAHKHLCNYGIDTAGIAVEKGMATSFTDVIQDRLTGERTFFTYGGANDAFTYDSIDYDSIDTDIFHMGYALLLAGMDARDPEYGTVMARTLAEVQRRGIKTSVDVVTEDSPRVFEIVRHCVKYCDYFIVNEEEASFTTGIPARDSRGCIVEENVMAMLRDLFRRGVRELAVIHSPECAYEMDNMGEIYRKESFHLPEGFIVGSVGAGDAFCAGMLTGIYRGMPIEDAMGFANGAAAACLSGSGGTDGMRSAEEIEKLMNELSSSRLQR